MLTEKVKKRKNDFYDKKKGQYIHMLGIKVEILFSPFDIPPFIFRIFFI